MCSAEPTASESLSRNWIFWYGVVAAQFLAFSIAVAGTFADLLGDDSMPNLMATGTYLFMCFTFLPAFIIREGARRKRQLWKYVALVLVDVSGSFCIIYSLKLTSVTSWTLLAPFSLVAVVPVTTAFLGASYNCRHFMSGLLAVAGLVLLVFSDAESTDSDDDHSTREDLCAMLGYSLFAVSSILVEVFLRSGATSLEVNAFLGLFGVFVAIAASFATGEISARVFTTKRIVVYTLIASFASLVSNGLAAEVLGTAGVPVQEISSLGSNIWPILAKTLVIGGFHVDLLSFPLAFCMIVLGMTFFVLSADPYNQKSVPQDCESIEMPRPIEVP